MLSLETLGRSLQREVGSVPLFVVGNLRSRALVQRVTEGLTESREVSARGWVLPSWLPGARSSDHWSFWKQGIPAVMLTGGGPLTYRHDHQRSDREDKIALTPLANIASAVTHATLRLCA